MFRFPVERYADKILPFAGAGKKMAGGIVNHLNTEGFVACADQNAPFNQPLALTPLTAPGI